MSRLLHVFQGLVWILFVSIFSKPLFMYILFLMAYKLSSRSETSNLTMDRFYSSSNEINSVSLVVKKLKISCSILTKQFISNTQYGFLLCTIVDIMRYSRNMKHSMELINRLHKLRKDFSGWAIMPLSSLLIMLLHLCGLICYILEDFIVRK